MLTLERAHLPIFPLFWTLTHVMDERSPLYGYDAARAIAADAQVFVTVEAHDPTLATTVRGLHNYSAKAIRFGMRYCDAMTTASDGTPVLDLTRIGTLDPDARDRPEQGWTEREE
jgi:inward rectifier potassium channel